MNISDDGVDFLKRWEKLFLVVYPDGYGYDTVGYGHRVLDGEDFSNGITEDEAENILLSDLEWAELAVNKYVKTDLTQNQYDALVSFTFNVGASAFKKSTLLKLVNIPGDDDEDEQFKRWVKAGGRRSRGLERRRKAEIAVFNEGDYDYEP